MHDAAILSFSSREAWVSGMVDAFRHAQADALKRRNRFTVAFSGGSTPRAFHEALAASPGLRWEHTHVFLGDERCVPADHPDSNLRMLRETLLDRITLPPANLHPWDTSLAPAEAASRMEDELRAVLGAEPAFDLILLGIGTDGHTASLFPGTAALDEPARFAVANAVPERSMTRLTFTLPCINAARAVWFLLAGPDKTPLLQQLAAPGCDLPAARVRRATVLHCVV
jgi:6-phosphogluconolactonase